jgi:fibronectin-binding autotransporter adhesin
MRKILAALLFFISVPVAAQEANFGFEDGTYNNWTVSNGSTSIRTSWSDSGSGAQVTTGVTNYCPGGGKCWTITPYGQYMLSIQAGGGSPTFDSAAANIGLTSTAISAIKSYLTYQSQNGGGGNPTPTNASFVKRSVFLEAGKTYTYAWNYLSTDYTPFNDGSLVAITGGPGNATVNNETTGYALLGFTNPGTGNYATGSYGSTGWQLIQFTVSATGTYTLGFMSFNLGDTALSPILFIDEITGSTQLNGQDFGPIAPNAGSNAPTTPTEPAGPTYCCGGSGDSFNANTANINKVDSFTNRTVKDSKVIIDQIGSGNSISVTQSGTRDNYFKYYGNGNNNTTTATQTGTGIGSTNYVDITVNGSSNNITMAQTGSGTKGIFAVVSNNNNTVNIQQKDSGNHYLDLSLSGSNKTVTVVQEGSAAHMALINLGGNPTSLSLTQSGSTQNFYSIVHSCATAGGCGTITVTQGQ